MNLDDKHLKVVQANDVQANDVQSNGAVTDATEEPQAIVLPDGERVPWDAFDWEGLIEDALTLWTYLPGINGQYDAIHAVTNRYYLEFLHRFRAAWKARSSAEWKQETFDRLKKEFEAKQQGKGK